MSQLSEIKEIETMLGSLKGIVRSEVIGESQDHDMSLPIHKIVFGSSEPEAPSLGLIGGVHGLERIGSQVCMALFSSLSRLVLWDKNTQDLLSQIRIYFIPIVNPIGILKKRRSNPRGVDLMRNAPVEAAGKIPFLLGGQRYSAKLPWYRGEEGQMEVENEALVKAIRAESFKSRVAITVDFHSGFGIQDQIWFPYAKNREPIGKISELYAFMDLFDKTYSHHFYKIEPQFYQTHGDVWDYLYDQHQSLQTKNTYLPLTLEMGSWIWVKKNPMQFLSMEGFFNPVMQHRYHRVLRRHNTFFDFLQKALVSHSVWADLNEEQKQKYKSFALERWYAKR